MYSTTLLDSLVRFQKDNPNTRIGGSVALILQNAIPYRPCKDIDIITATEVQAQDLVGTVKVIRETNWMYYTYDNLRCDVLCDPKVVDSEPVRYNHSAGIIKLDTVDRVVYWKTYYINKKWPFTGEPRGLDKHRDDLAYIQSNK